MPSLSASTCACSFSVKLLLPGFYYPAPGVCLASSLAHMLYGLGESTAGLHIAQFLNLKPSRGITDSLDIWFRTSSHLVRARLSSLLASGPVLF